MDMTMNSEDAIARKETKETIEKPRSENAPAERWSEDFVRRGEFRLALWTGAFVLTAILGGFTFLYTELTNLRITMEQQHTGLRVEISDLRAEVIGLRAEVAVLHERVVRIESSMAFDHLQ